MEYHCMMKKYKLMEPEGIITGKISKKEKDKNRWCHLLVFCREPKLRVRQNQTENEPLKADYGN